MSKVLLFLTALCLALSNANAWAAATKLLDADIRIEVITTTSGAINPERVVVALIPKNGQMHTSVRKAIVQSNAQFRPFISVAQPGSVIEFPNHDEFAHHVYSFSKAMSFELPLYTGDQKHEVRLKEAGIVPIGCNIHDWMLGYIVVVNTPHVTFLNKTNIAEFKDMPVGEYQLAVWHPSMDNFWIKPVSISNANSHLVISLPVSLSPVEPLPAPDIDDFGHDY